MHIKLQQYLFIQGNVFKNVICKMAAISLGIHVLRNMPVGIVFYPFAYDPASVDHRNSWLLGSGSLIIFHMYKSIFYDKHLIFHALWNCVCLPQAFVHAPTAVLSGHVQKLVVLKFLHLKSQENIEYFHQIWRTFMEQAPVYTRGSAVLGITWWPVACWNPLDND